MHIKTITNDIIHYYNDIQYVRDNNDDEYQKYEITYCHMNYNRMEGMLICINKGSEMSITW